MTADGEEIQHPGRRRLDVLASLPVACALAVVAGSLASLVGLPLAWLLGAGISTALIGLAVRPVRVPRPLYRAGQLFVGMAVGLTVAEDVMGRLGLHALVAPLGALISLGIGRALFPILERRGGVDRATAFFSLVPAGIAEMAEQAGRRGADMAAVGTFHACRVGLMVLVMPLLVLLFREPVAAEAAAAGPSAWSAALLPAFGIAVAVAPAASRLGLPSAWMLGPMLALGVLSGFGLLHASLPPSLLAVAQILLGLGIGARFTHATLARLPRALSVGLPLMMCHAICVVALALALAWSLGLTPTVLILGFATGGIAEMVLTAKAVGIDATLVTAYQVARGVLGNLLAGTIFDRGVARRAPRPDA